MPEIHPFRAAHYPPGDLTKLVTQPYDRIDEKLQKAYYERDPHNFVRVDKPVGTQEQAAAELRVWMMTGVMAHEPAPALYAYHQESGGRVRKGLTAMVKLEDRIHPHEETHTGPKADRLKMLRAMRTHISHVFLLYSDPGKVVNSILDPHTQGAPMLTAPDDFGEMHKVWKIDDAKVIPAICHVIGPCEAIIADGHHRYETAVTYRNEMRAKGARCEGAESFENVLATLVNMDDALTIFGTHRVIHGLAKVDLHKLDEVFEVTEPEDVKAALAAETSRPAFGLIQPNRKPRLLAVRDVKAAADRVNAPKPFDAPSGLAHGKSEEWRSLDVNILHTVILNDMLGITPEHTAREMHVDYLRSADEAIGRAQSGHAQLAFLVNPVRIEQIRAIVAKGERFPQKTTDFYPKLLSGMLLCPLNFTRG